MAYRRFSLIDLYLHTKFHRNRKNVLWTDGRTYGRTDGHLRPILSGRLRRVDLKSKENMTRRQCSKAFHQNEDEYSEIALNPQSVTRRMAIANGTCVIFCNQPKAHFGLPWVRPWVNRGKYCMDGKRIQCWSNA